MSTNEGVCFHYLGALPKYHRILRLLIHCRGQLQEYMELLVRAFNPAAAETVMCRNTVSVGWDGRLFDCDFNQQLDISMASVRNLPSEGATVKPSVFNLTSLDDLDGRPITVASHCFGCTAGEGSSCQGAIS